MRGKAPNPGRNGFWRKTCPRESSVRVEKVSLTDIGYTFFDFTTSPDVQSVDLTIVNTISLSSSAAGGDGQQGT